jgi:Diguanylate cyclase, GGDEF domain
VGDRALIAIADVLRDNTCHDAAVARIGGEEFLIAELVADAGMCKQQAERVRSAIASTVFGTTASVGVAAFRFGKLPFWTVASLTVRSKSLTRRCMTQNAPAAIKPAIMQQRNADPACTTTFPTTLTTANEAD